MLLIVPDSGRFAAVAQQLSPDFVGKIDASLSEREPTLSIPKWTTEREADLVTPLQALGVRDLFDPTLADLSGIETVEPLYISHVAHKANITVDEQGTEASAATASVAEATSGAQGVTLTIDRSFIYLIRDAATDETLFMGSVADPR